MILHQTRHLHSPVMIQTAAIRRLRRDTGETVIAAAVVHGVDEASTTQIVPLTRVVTGVARRRSPPGTLLRRK